MTVGPAEVIDRLVGLQDLGVLDGYHATLTTMVARRLSAHDDPLAICHSIAAAHEALTIRLIDLATEELGPAPCRYTWLSLGSHGRREQVLSSDQDNAIAFDTAPGTRQGEVEDYFRALSLRVTGGLARAGIPECDGGFMATQWSRPLEEYVAMFRAWVDTPEPEALLRAEVFLDIRALHGTLPISPLHRALRVGGSRGPFRAQMARAAVTFRPRIGWFGRLAARDGDYDLKAGGTAAVVLLARLYAFVAGSTDAGTIARLEAAAAGGVLHRETADNLAEAYRFLTALRLQRQVESVERQEPPDNRVRLQDLSTTERGQLRRHLRTIANLQEVTAGRFATYTLI